MKFNTALLHLNYESERSTGSTVMPIYQVSAFSHDSPETLERIFNNRAKGFAYSRISNPTVDSLEKRIASIEHGIGAVACSSGMAAVTMSLLNILKSGDEVIASAGLFGGTIDLFSDLKSFGIYTKFVSEFVAEKIEPLITENTKVLFTELIGNPKLNIVDINSISNLAHRYNIPFILDSTTATPYLINPIDFGADIVIHSSSKYINGGGNAISGVIVDSGNYKWNESKFEFATEYKKYGEFAYIAKLRNGIWRNVGCCLAPMNAFLNTIGIETLGLRMERLCKNALSLAEFLDDFEEIEVNYPALKSSKYYQLANEQLGGNGGAILTIRTGSKENAFRLLNSLKLPLIATNIGDVRTLVIHPYSTIYAHSSEEQKLNAGVYDDTIRISIGIEDIEDLKEDFRQAINNMKGE